MNEEELAAIVLALRQMQARPEEAESAIAAWRLAEHFPELDLMELKAMSSSGRRVF